MTKRLGLLLLCLSLFSANYSRAQISVVDSQTAVQLVQKLAGPGVTFSNVTLTCPLRGEGIFTTTSSNLNLTSGIVLTCGRAEMAAGPASIFASTPNGTAGDASLNALISPQTTNDACILEFDFVPIGDTVKFRYVFGSEEYPGYACTTFNDVFGFFISGPGITGTKNIAIIPNTTIPVAINSTSGVVGTNGGQLSVCQSMGTGSPFIQYYVNNNSGTTVTYNGFTTILTAIAEVVPCSTYHLKLAVADAVDGSFDSGVFLEAGSFSSNLLTISTASNLQAPVPYCVRGCKNGSFQFKRQKVTSLPLTIKYLVSGTAVNGTDYTQIPDSVIIPGNDSVVNQTIVPLTTASGTKTIKLYIYSPFSCTATPVIFDSSTVTIYDSLFAQTAMPDTGVCPGGSIQIQTTGDTILKYKWTPSTGLNYDTLRNPTCTPLVTKTYFVTATLPNSTCASVRDSINITIYTPPNITAEPINRTVCEGSNTTFSLTATGKDLTYQWQVSSGAAFSNLTNTPPYNSVTTSGLNIGAVPLSLSGRQYRCIVSGKCVPKDTSVAATLTVQTLPAITQQSHDSTICEGGSASFKITATGSNITYQWQANGGSGYNDISNGGSYSGATSNTLLISNAPASMAHDTLRCVVSGSCTPAAVSNKVLLTVHTKPNVTVEPANSAVCPDSPAFFHATVTGGVLVYQWQGSTGAAFTNIVNTGIYSGATTNHLALSAAAAAMTGYKYRCIINGFCPPPDTTVQATLTINELPDITTQPHDSTLCAGANASFAITAIGTGISYQWQVKSGASAFTNITNSAVYGGSNSNKLTLTAPPTSLSGNQYRCYIVGDCKPADTSAAAVMTVNSLPFLAIDAHDSTVCEGDPASFAIAAFGTGIGYQWQGSPDGVSYSNITNNAVYSGATSNTLALSTTNAGMTGYKYRCTVTGVCTPAVTSSIVTLTVNIRPDITSTPHDSIVCEGNNASFSITGVGTGLNYQWQVKTGTTFTNVTNSSVYSGSNTNTLNISAAAFSMTGYRYRCFITGTCTPADTSSSALLTIYTLPFMALNPHDSTVCEGDPASFAVTAFGTNISYQWQSSPTGTSYTNITNNAVYSGATTNTLNLSTTTASLNSYKYRCLVTGTCPPAVTSSAVTLTVNIRPDVTTQSHDTTVCEGTTATFSIAAIGTGLNYQWQHNTGSGYTNLGAAAPYSGANTNTLTVTGPGYGMNGFLYRCIITGTCTPPDTSQQSLLTVNLRPAITLHPQDHIICEDGNTSFIVSATGTAITYQWQVNSGSGYTNISNTSIFNGVNSNTLLITGANAGMNNTFYRCVVAGACMPDAISNSAELTVFTKPDVTSQPHDSTICDGNNSAFSISATGTAIHYQWQVNNGSGYTNLSDNSTYNGVTTNALSLAAAGFALNNYKYRCIVTGSCTPPDTSAQATLTVLTLPDITQQPHDSTICEGGNASYGISATGSFLNYQWQVNAGIGFVNVGNSSLYSGATTNALSITAGTAGMNNYYYRCIVTGACTPPDTSTQAKLTVRLLPDISTQPKDTTICDKKNGGFTIVATGTSITYQWQVNTGSSYENISNGSLYSGTTTNTLAITAADTGMNNYLYRCIVSGICTPPDTSAGARLTVNILPDILSQPKDSTVCEGDDATFSIVAAGAAITYQWQVNNGSGFTNVINSTRYSGATAATLVIDSAAAFMHNYDYRCLVTGACQPPDTSTVARLTVHTRPDITLQPHDSIVCEGSNASFAIIATGTNIVYQWQVNTGSGYANVSNGGVYSGATTNKLSLVSNISMDSFRYRCIVAGICAPNDTSVQVLLKVRLLPLITQHPQDSTICTGNNASFTISAIGTFITYQWQVDNGSGFTNVSNSAIYGGTTTNTLTLTGADTLLDSCRYRCIASGICTPPDTSTAATLYISTPPAITSVPFATQICEGGDALFTVGAKGTNLKYQWQQNTGSGYFDINDGSIYNGTKTGSLLISNVTTAMSGYMYQCVISGDCPPSIVSGTLTLTLTVFTKPSVTLQATSSKICEGNNTSFTIAGAGTGIFYQWQVDTGTGYNNVVNNFMYSGAGSATLNITGATMNMSGYQYRGLVKGVCLPDAIAQAVTLTVDTIPVILIQPKDTTVCEETPAVFTLTARGTQRVYQWQLNNGTGFVSVANGPTYGGVNTNTLQIFTAKQFMQGWQYRCIISGLCNPPDTSVVVALDIDTIPVITIQPHDSIICEGDNASFSVTANGTNIYYQWQVDEGLGFSNIGANIYYSGANTNTLNITGAPAGMNNFPFRCIVSGTCMPPDTSLVSILTVRKRPHITLQPQDSIICEGSNASFKITVTGTSLSYQWQVNNGSGFTNVANSSIYSGVTSGTLLVTAGNFGLNNYYYRCIVSGACPPPDTSTQAKLTVRTLPDITMQPHDSIICEGNNVSFAIAATGTSINYQWQVNTGSGYANVINSTIYAGTATNTLSITAGSAGMDNYYYRCIVTGICTPPDTSLQARLTVRTLPNVTLQPLDSAICEATDGAFVIAATGTALTYQWQVNGGAGYINLSNNATYNGATDDTLHILAAPYSMNSYQYRCIVSGSCTPPATSLAKTLTVYTSPVITQEPLNTIVCRDDTTALTVASTGAFLTYQWQIDTGTTGFHNVINSSYYAGATANILGINGAVTSMNGDKFRCIVNGKCSPPDTSVTVNLSVYTPPDIVNQPHDTSVCPESNMSFRIYAIGSLLTYKWQVDIGAGFNDIANNALYDGATTTLLKLTNVQPPMNGYRYRCIVSGYCDTPAISDAVTLEIYPKPNAEIIPEGATTFCKGQSINLDGQPKGTLVYQWRLNGTDIPGAMNSVYVAADSGVYTLVIYNGFCYSTSQSLPLTVNPVPSAEMNVPGLVICKDSSVTLSVIGPDENDTWQWKRNDKDIAGGNLSDYVVTTAGTYGFIATNKYGCSTRSIYKYIEQDETPDPFISTDNILLCTQIDYELYEWYWNETPVFGAAARCYLPRDNGAFMVKTTNFKGCTRSSNVHLIDETLIVIWPNPTSGVVNILSGEAATVNLCDVDGKVILARGNVKQIDIGDVANGIYMLKVYDKNGKLLKAERISKISR